MRSFKKTIAIILCLIMAAGSFAYAEEVQLISAQLKDYEGHWAQATIQKWMDEGRVSGYPDGSYKPDAKVTRAEFVKLVNSIIDFNKKAPLTYKDVPATEWYHEYVGVAQNIGYISGYSADKFGPNDYITREQAASILSRIQYLENNEAGANSYADIGKISSWAKGSVGAAAKAGFISGYTDGSFKPLNNLTRAEALTMVDNVLVNRKNYVIYNDKTQLKDFVVDGNLVIAKTVGDGDVYLDNVQVKGKIYVYGGGVNSVYFNNMKVSKIVVEKDKVRLVFDKGASVEEVEVTSEAILDNKDGTVAKITLAGEKAVTLTGEFKEVIITGNSNIVLNNAKIETLIVEKPIVIQGTGTVATLNANANGITFEAEVEIKKTVVGEGVTEKPAPVEEPAAGGGGGAGGGGTGGSPVNVLQITMKLPDASEANTFNTDEYSDSSIMSNFFAAEAGKILARDSAVINNYIAVLNSRISNVKINDITLNSSDGWDKAIAYIDGTTIEEQVAALKTDLLDGISKAELTEVLGLYSSLKTSDIDIIKGKITNLDSKVLTYINDGVVSYTVTFEKGTAPVGNKAVAEFILDQFKSSTVKEFFETYGKVTFTAKYGEKTSVITIDSVEL